MLPVRSLTTGQDHSYNYLRQGILSGEFESGSRINLEHGAASLRIRLATEGLVTIYPRRGVRVTSLAPDEINELFEVGSVPEGLAGRHAHPRMSKADFTKLEELAENISSVEGQPASWFRPLASISPGPAIRRPNIHVAIHVKPLHY